MIMRRRTAALSVGHEIVPGFVYLLVTKRSFGLETKRSNIKEAKPDTINPLRERMKGLPRRPRHLSSFADTRSCQAGKA
jgi:hypothetical protein